MSGQQYGFDWRIGARLTPNWSVYMQTHLSLGTNRVNRRDPQLENNLDGLTANLATAVMAERDLPGRTFVAAGGGYGALEYVVLDPSGPLLALRAGWYPMKHADGLVWRMNLSLDARWYLVDYLGRGLTVSHIAVSFGYDRF